MFIIFWDFLKVEQIFCSPQVKRSVIISLLIINWYIKLSLRVAERLKNASRKSQNFIALLPSALVTNIPRMIVTPPSNPRPGKSLHHGSMARAQSKKYYFKYMYSYYTPFCWFSSRNLCFHHFYFFFWWSIKFPEQNINQSDTGIGDENLSVELLSIFFRKLITRYTHYLITRYTHYLLWESTMYFRWEYFHWKFLFFSWIRIE